MPVIV